MKLTIEVEAPDHHVVPGLAASLAPEVARLASNQLNGAKFVVVSASEDGVQHPDFAVVDELPEVEPEVVEVVEPKPAPKPRATRKSPMVKESRKPAAKTAAKKTPAKRTRKTPTDLVAALEKSLDPKAE